MANRKNEAEIISWSKPSLTERRKKGTKHHITTEAQGIHLAVRITEANRHGVTGLMDLLVRPRIMELIMLQALNLACRQASTTVLVFN